MQKNINCANNRVGISNNQEEPHASINFKLFLLLSRILI